MYLKCIFLVLSLLASGATAASTADRYHPDMRSAGAPPAVPQAEMTNTFWFNDAHNTINSRLNAGDAGRPGKARNLIMFLGDGMSIPTIAAARTLLGQRNNRTGEEAQLSFETFPTTGLVKVL